MRCSSKSERATPNMPAKLPEPPSLLELRVMAVGVVCKPLTFPGCARGKKEQLKEKQRDDTMWQSTLREWFGGH